MYIKRHGEETVHQLAKMFGAVLVTGSRQVGKTTLLQNVIGNISSVSLDDPLQLAAAVGQSITFFKDNPPPVLIDEIQHAPNLFMQMKLILDQSRKKGQFFMTGSQHYHMMKNVSESLAGRLGLLSLPGLSLREKQGINFSESFLPTEEFFARRKQQESRLTYDEVWSDIHRGCMPELCVNKDFDWQLFYGAYVKTYLERDVRDLTQVGDSIKFLQFMTVAASSIGQLINLASLARDVGISQPTAERWLSILVTSNIVYLLRPYSNNITKRTVKTPKLYFLDTGLAAYLTRWTSPEVLKAGAMAGAFFENYVVSEIIKSYLNKGILELPLYFYRDQNMNEIDLLIENGGILYPLEMKKHADPSVKDIKAFNLLDNLPSIKRGPGGVVCLYENLVSLKGQDRVIPVHFL